MKTPATTVSAELLGTRFRFQTSPGLFSTDRVDDGTKLLLSHLPEHPPQSMLDLGCGYGALGLPVAARFLEARCLLVDRDVLAVDAAARNATAAGLTNVTCQPSLGYRDVKVGSFDWVLCNVPARIGTEAIRYMLGAGAQRLTATGELRVVVIRDLGPVVEAIGREENWPIEHVADGPRHKIYRLAPIQTRELDAVDIYQRDSVMLAGRSLQRPQDISESPTHQTEGLPLLLEFIEREMASTAFVWRGGYGAAATALAAKGATVVTADRDLLATTFTLRNAAGSSVTAHDVLWPHQIGKHQFDLVVAESAPQAGIDSGQREMAECLQLLHPRGSVIWLAPARLMKDILKTMQSGAGSILAQRGDWSVARLRRR